MIVAVIGYGYWGPNLARVWNQNKRSELRYICDKNPERLADAQLDFPYVKTTEDYFNVINDPEVEAVNIVTSIVSHFEIAKQALLQNKHVLIEKPLTGSEKEARELVSLAEEKGKCLMVGHIFLYNPAVVKIKDYISVGLLGKIDFMQLTRINLGKIKHDYNVIWDLAPHDFSIVYYWLDSLPEWIQVVGKSYIYKNVCDVAFITMQYPGEILVNIHLSWLSPVKLRQTYIVSEKNMIVYDDTHTLEKVKVYDSGVEVKEPETFGEFQLTYRSGDIHVPRLENEEPLMIEINHFLDCIEEGATPRTGPNHAVAIIEMIEAAQHSLSNNGERVHFKQKS